MSVIPETDHGQQLTLPEGRAIGFVNTHEQLDAVTQALNKAGYGDAKIIALHGEDGIEMLQRLQTGFNFGDGEDNIMVFAIKELEAGHYTLGIEVSDRADAMRVVSLSEPHGAHSFGYFGTWVNELLTR